MFNRGPIDGVIVKEISRRDDERGWLSELFRHDELDEAWHPVMAYVSMTLPGVARGPHEHRRQADLFAFLGPSTFRLYLWDGRPNSPTYRNRSVEDYGVKRPATVIIPPGVVHAYCNVGAVDGLVINAPNRLYKGPGRTDEVDEIRHEADADTIYVLD